MRRDNYGGNSITTGNRITPAEPRRQTGFQKSIQKKHIPLRAEWSFDCLQVLLSSNPSLSSGQKYMLGQVLVISWKNGIIHAKCPVHGKRSIIVTSLCFLIWYSFYDFWWQSSRLGEVIHYLKKGQWSSWQTPPRKPDNAMSHFEQWNRCTEKHNWTLSPGVGV